MSEPTISISVVGETVVTIENIDDAAEKILRAGAQRIHLENLPQQEGRYWAVYGIRLLSADPPEPL